MSRTILLTGPELAAEAMNLAAEHGVRIIPTTPVSYTHLTLPTNREV